MNTGHHFLNFRRFRTQKLISTNVFLLPCMWLSYAKLCLLSTIFLFLYIIGTFITKPKKKQKKKKSQTLKAFLLSTLIIYFSINFFHFFLPPLPSPKNKPPLSLKANIRWEIWEPCQLCNLIISDKRPFPHLGPLLSIYIIFNRTTNLLQLRVINQLAEKTNRGFLI